MYRDEIALVTLLGGAGVLVLVFWWGLMAISVGIVAMERKRSFGAWLIVALVLSPFFAALLLIAAGDAKKVQEDILAQLNRIRSAMDAAKKEKPNVVTETAWANRAREEREAKKSPKPPTEDDMAKYLETGERPVPRD